MPLMDKLLFSMLVLTTLLVLTLPLNNGILLRNYLLKNNTLLSSIWHIKDSHLEIQWKTELPLDYLPKVIKFLWCLLNLMLKTLVFMDKELDVFLLSPNLKKNQLMLLDKWKELLEDLILTLLFTELELSKLFFLALN